MRAVMFIVLLIISLSASATHVTFSSTLPAEQVVAKLELVSPLHGFKWIRKVPLSEEFGPDAPAGWAVYFCDVPYMASRKAENPFAGATGPCRSVVLTTELGSELRMNLPSQKRVILDESESGCFSLDMRMLAVATLATDTVWDTIATEVDTSWLYTRSSDSPYPEAMNEVQHTVSAAGFGLVRVQHMDKGLTAGGYQSGPYKILYVQPTNTPVSALTELSASLPIAILVMEDADGFGKVATLGLSAATSTKLTPEVQLWLADTDAKLRSSLDNF